jgi:hypothetical protein
VVRVFGLAPASVRVLVVPLVALGLAAGSGAAAAAPGRQGGPDAGESGSVVSLLAVLTGVAATSARHALAVGYTQEFGQPAHPVVLQWAGKAWKRVGGLRPADASLEGVAAVSAGDAWAVGYAGSALILHGAGGKWRRSATPATGTGSRLLAVAASSPRSAWAVGCVSCESGSTRPLALRWNGQAWRRVALPRTASGSELLGVAVSSARSAWAVGCTRCGSAGSRPLAVQWNGRSWRVATLPGAGTASQLSGVTVAGRAGWAVGCAKCDYAQGKALVLRWDGTAWQRARVPAVPGPSQLSAVTARSARLAWAVGSGGRSTVGYPNTLILRWNGTAWMRVPSPTSKANGGGLLGVTATSAANAWAVGNNFNDEAQTVIVRWNGHTWKQE